MKSCRITFSAFILALAFMLFSCSHKRTANNHTRLKNSSLTLLINNKEVASACFISSDGLILTAAHPLSYLDDKLEVISPLLGRLQAKLIAIDKGHDCMLLQAQLHGGKATYLNFAQSLPASSEDIYQIGSPVFRRGLMQRGHIASQNSDYEYYGGTHNHYVEIIHIAGMSQAGTSGAPWVNSKGELIGIQSGTLMVGDSPAGIAFMSEISQLQPLITTKKNSKSYNLDCRVSPLETYEPRTIKQYKEQRFGLVVDDISKSSLAFQAGLKHGDLIVAVNNTPVKTTKDLLNRVSKSSENKVQLTFFPKGKTNSLSKEVTLEVIEDRLKFKQVNPL